MKQITTVLITLSLLFLVGSAFTLSEENRLINSESENDYELLAPCTSTSNFPWHEWISNVQLESISNSSAKTTYSNFTNLSTDLSKGGTFSITLTTKYSYYTYDQYWRVWIDYNNNDTFDAGEKVVEKMMAKPANGSGVTETITESFTVPSSVSNGSKTMRISMRRGAYANPCGSIDFGEIEDYAVNIINGSGCTPGDSCDDGNPNNCNDVYDSSCNCSGSACPGVDLKVTIEPQGSPICYNNLTVRYKVENIGGQNQMSGFKININDGSMAYSGSNQIPTGSNPSAGSFNNWAGGPNSYDWTFSSGLAANASATLDIISYVNSGSNTVTATIIEFNPSQDGVSSNNTDTYSYTCSSSRVTAVAEGIKTTKESDQEIEIESVSNTEESINIYPNPVKDILFINTKDLTLSTGNTQLKIYNGTGQVQTIIENFPQNNLIEFSTDKLNSGIYFISVERKGEQPIVRSFVVNRTK